MTNLFKISFRPGEEVSARLEAIDRDPARIDLVITGAAPVTSALDTEKCLRRKLSGTSGSNPLSSSAESGANLASGPGCNTVVVMFWFSLPMARRDESA